MKTSRVHSLASTRTPLATWTPSSSSGSCTSLASRWLQSAIHPVSHSFIQPVSHSFSQPFVQSAVPFIQSAIRSVSHSFIQSAIHPVSHSSSQPFVQSVSHSVSHLFSQPFIQSAIRSVSHSFIHSGGWHRGGSTLSDGSTLYPQTGQMCQMGLRWVSDGSQMGLRGAPRSVSKKYVTALSEASGRGGGSK